MMMIKEFWRKPYVHCMHTASIDHTRDTGYIFMQPANAYKGLKVRRFTHRNRQTKERFKKSAQAYQAVLNQELFDHIYRDLSPSGRVRMGMSRMINLEELPRYQYQRASLSESFYNSALDLGILLFFGVFSFVLAYVSFHRYDIR